MPAPSRGKRQELCPWTPPEGSASWAPSKGGAFAIHLFGWVEGWGMAGESGIATMAMPLSPAIPPPLHPAR